MRRDIWLAGVAGVVVGSWLTLIVVQLEEHGFGLPERSSTQAQAESRPVAATPTPAPVETAKADTAPAVVTPATSAPAVTNPITTAPAATTPSATAAATTPATVTPAAEIPTTTAQAQTPPADTAKTEAAPATDTQPQSHDTEPAQASTATEQTAATETAIPDSASPTAVATTGSDDHSPAPATTAPIVTARTEPASTAISSAIPIPIPRPDEKTTDIAASSDQPAKEPAKEKDNDAVAQPVTKPEIQASVELAQPKTNPPDTAEVQSVDATPAKANEMQTETKDAGNPGTDKDTSVPDASKQPSSDLAKAQQAPPQWVPADQADRELAALAHQTAPAEGPTQQASLEGQQKPADDAAKPVELVRPFADRAGVLTIAGKSVQLPGIVPTDVDRMCTGPNGKSWPCGAAARTAFRMYLRGRTIDCDLPSTTWEGTVTGACRYVRIDLSEWLVRFGWAEPETGSPLVALAEVAKQQKRGIYGDDPRKGAKSTLAPDLPKEDPLNPI